MAEADFIKAFREELTGLRQPEKPRINGLTMLAEANQNYAEAIVRAIEQHIHEVCELIASSTGSAECWGGLAWAHGRRREAPQLCKSSRAETCLLRLPPAACPAYQTNT